jgi:hypothetical protein
MRKLTIAILLWAGGLCGQTVINGGRTVKGAWDASGAASTKPARTGTALPATCSNGELFLNTAATAGQNLYVCQPTNTWIQQGGAATANVRARGIGYLFDGGGAPLSAGITRSYSVPYACTISSWDMTVDAGTATVDVWKVASGTTTPGSANSITASATPAIASGTALHGSDLTSWTTSVAAHDIVAFHLSAVAGATAVSLVLECDQ